jgi:hypothetical protein
MLIILLIITIYPQVLFQGLIHSFRLPIRLRVICYRLIPLNIQPFEEMPSKLRDKLRALVRDSVYWEVV